MSAVNTPAEDGDSFSSKVTKTVFLVLLLDLLGFTLILPLLPSILDHYAQTGVSVVHLILSTLCFLLQQERYLTMHMFC